MLGKPDSLGEDDGVMSVGHPDVIEARLMVRGRSDNLEASLGIEEENDLSASRHQRKAGIGTEASFACKAYGGGLLR